MNRQWYYNQDGAQYGPVDEAEIIRQIQSGELPPGTPVLKKGSMDWKPARDQVCFQVEIYPRKKHTSKTKSEGPDLSIDPDLEAELIRLAENIGKKSPPRSPSIPPIIGPAPPVASSATPAPQGFAPTQPVPSQGIHPPVQASNRWLTYGEVPWHQKNGFVSAMGLIGFFLCAPTLWIACIIVITGEVYMDEYDQNGNLKTYGIGQKILYVVLSILSAIWMFAVLSGEV